MDYLAKIIVQIALHSVEGIKNCFVHGVNPTEVFRGLGKLLFLPSTRSAVK